MGALSFHMNETGGLSGRLAKLKPSAILGYAREEIDARDEIHLSADAKKRQVLDQARTEVLHYIRRVK